MEDFKDPAALIAEAERRYSGLSAAPRDLILWVPGRLAYELAQALRASNDALTAAQGWVATTAWCLISVAIPKTAEPIVVQTAGGWVFKAYLGEMVEGDDGCEHLAWAASIEGMHPPSWTDGLCWALNEDGAASDPPIAWMPLPTPQGAQELPVKDNTWRQPPPHFKADPRWQRQPQSDAEWDRHLDTDHPFNAKRRLAFAGDMADLRAPPGMALVSRWDISTVLSRLTWLEARFGNTKASCLPPADQTEEPS